MLSNRAISPARKLADWWTLCEAVPENDTVLVREMLRCFTRTGPTLLLLLLLLLSSQLLSDHLSSRLAAMGPNSDRAGAMVLSSSKASPSVTAAIFFSVFFNMDCSEEGPTGAAVYDQVAEGEEEEDADDDAVMGLKMIFDDRDE